MRILMVEDEIYIAEAIAQVLKNHHYSVDLAHDGEFGLDCAFTGIYDFIILDIMLPKKDGFTVLEELRQNDINTPVILLTARGGLDDKIQGLDCGADDYLAKPFHAEELLARLRALGRRRSEWVLDGLLTLDDLVFNPHSLSLSCNNAEVKLTLKEAQLLELLLSRKQAIVSKEVIIEKLWGYDSDAESSHVENQISLLRKKLNLIKSQVAIRTLRGAGYTLSEKKDG
ncbi:response regulator transcription factor [Lysinibacillus sp. RS5]|uniref:response regulator transcription factor n=1 Tax=unclassified Lysinibacillus TaxID=2636778 RepID=UPI0035BE8351